MLPQGGSGKKIPFYRGEQYFFIEYSLIQVYLITVMSTQQQLFTSICRLAGEAAVNYNMTREGDRLLVGLSGGKDSFVLMHVLEHLQKAAPVNFSFAAATF